MAARAHHRPDVTEITRDLRVETANARRTLFDIRRAEQNAHQILHLAAHLLGQLTGLRHVIFQQIAANAANQVHAVGFARAGQDFRHLHGGFTHAEKLHKAGVEPDKMARQTEIQQVAVQPLDFQQNGADRLRALRHLNTHRVFHRRGVGRTVGKAADTADAVGEKRHFVIAHAGFGEFLHAAVDVKEPVVGIEDVFAIHEQPEVARLVGGDMQRADGHHVIFGIAQLIDELIGFFIAGRRRALAVIHAVFAQRIEVVRPVIRQHQAALIRQADRDQTIHIAHFALAPDGGGHARRHRRKLRFIRVHLDTHRYPALHALLHREHVVDRVAAAELALVVAKQHRQPAALLVVKKLHHFRQIIDFHRDRQLVFGLPAFIKHHAGKCLVQRAQIVLPCFFFRHCSVLLSCRQQGDES
ncbi:hypothetical protein BN128_662 [Cronobacter sakazakii 696]|nr:hypothetical protein BN128_662 [Cronobacter sakazakii 696]